MRLFPAFGFGGRFAALFCCAALGAAAGSRGQAQKLPVPDPDAPSLLSDVPAVPGLAARLRGVNGGLTLAGVHDSGTGWYQVLTPAVEVSFPHRLSADWSFPVYLNRRAEIDHTTTVMEPVGPGGQPVAVEVTTASYVQPRFDPGDMVLAVHAAFSGFAREGFGGPEAGRLQDVVTASLTTPSGDTETGLSTGRVTFDVDNHAQWAARRVSFVLDVGGGDSSSLVNRLVTRDYTSLGPLAHFQTGFLVPLPGFRARRPVFEAVAYEQLPLGDSKIYTTISRPGRPAETVVTGRSASEDNGFTNSLAVPLAGHLTLQGYYNRSLRLKLDTAAVSLTWVARSYRAPVVRRDGIDDLIRK